MSDSKDDSLFVGKTCNGLILQGFEFKGELQEEASVVFICVNDTWHRFGIDSGYRFGSELKEKPEPWEVTEEGWKYPHRDIGEEFGFTDKKIVAFQDMDYENFRLPYFIRIDFEDGRQFLLENENDLSTFRIVE